MATRASSRSSAISGCWARAKEKNSPSTEISGRRTMVPTPCRISTTPIIDSARNASRSIGRETPSCRQSSRSGVRRSPGLMAPARNWSRRKAKTLSKPLLDVSSGRVMALFSNVLACSGMTIGITTRTALVNIPGTGPGQDRYSTLRVPPRAGGSPDIATGGISGCLGGDGAETPKSETEEQATDERNREELRPDNVDASPAIKDRLREGNEMGRRGRLHDGRELGRHAFERRVGAGEHVHGQVDQHVEQAELRYRARHRA